MELYLTISAVCLVVMIACTWFAKEDLTITALGLYVFSSIIPLVNLFAAAFMIICIVSDNRKAFDITILKGRK
jgi:hypothetical protein